MKFSTWLYQFPLLFWYLFRAISISLLWCVLESWFQLSRLWFRIRGKTCYGCKWVRDVSSHGLRREYYCEANAKFYSWRCYRRRVK